MIRSICVNGGGSAEIQRRVNSRMRFQSRFLRARRSTALMRNAGNYANREIADIMDNGKVQLFATTTRGSARPHVRSSIERGVLRRASRASDDFIELNHPVGLAKTTVFVRVFARRCSRKRQETRNAFNAPILDVRRDSPRVVDHAGKGCCTGTRIGTMLGKKKRPSPNAECTSKRGGDGPSESRRENYAVGSDISPYSP